MIYIDVFSNSPPSIEPMIIYKRKRKEATIKDIASVCHRMTLENG